MNILISSSFCSIIGLTEIFEAISLINFLFFLSFSTKSTVACSYNDPSGSVNLIRNYSCLDFTIYDINVDWNRHNFKNQISVPWYTIISYFNISILNVKKSQFWSVQITNCLFFSAIKNEWTFWTDESVDFFTTCLSIRTPTLKR